MVQDSVGISLFAAKNKVKREGEKEDDSQVEIHSSDPKQGDVSSSRRRGMKIILSGQVEVTYPSNVTIHKTGASLINLPKFSFAREVQNCPTLHAPSSVCQIP